MGSGAWQWFSPKCNKHSSLIKGVFLVLPLRWARTRPLCEAKPSPVSLCSFAAWPLFHQGHSFALHFIVNNIQSVLYYVHGMPLQCVFLDNCMSSQWERKTLWSPAFILVFALLRLVAGASGLLLSKFWFFRAVTGPPPTQFPCAESAETYH